MAMALLCMIWVRCIWMVSDANLMNRWRKSGLQKLWMPLPRRKRPISAKITGNTGSENCTLWGMVWSKITQPLSSGSPRQRRKIIPMPNMLWAVSISVVRVWNKTMPTRFRYTHRQRVMKQDPMPMPSISLVLCTKKDWALPWIRKQRQPGTHNPIGGSGRWSRPWQMTSCTIGWAP